MLDGEGLSHHRMLFLPQDLASNLLLVLASLCHVNRLAYLLHGLCVSAPLLHRVSRTRTLEHAIDLLILL